MSDPTTREVSHEPDRPKDRPAGRPDRCREHQPEVRGAVAGRGRKVRDGQVLTPGSMGVERGRESVSGGQEGSGKTGGSPHTTAETPTAASKDAASPVSAPAGQPAKKDAALMNLVKTAYSSVAGEDGW